MLVYFLGSAIFGEYAVILVLLLKFLGTGTTELDRTNTRARLTLLYLHPRPKTSNMSLGMRVLVSYSCLWQHITQKKRGGRNSKRTNLGIIQRGPNTAS